MLEGSNRFMPSDPMKKFVQVMDVPPFAITDHIGSSLFLQTDGKDNHFFHNLVVLVHRHGLSPINEVSHNPRPWQ